MNRDYSLLWLELLIDMDSVADGLSPLGELYKLWYRVINMRLYTTSALKWSP